MIDRKKYLELCQINSVYPNREFVLWGELKYYPKSLEISFDKEGKTINTAILKDVLANSLLNCRLQDITYIDK